MGEIARSKSRIANDLKTRNSDRWRPCDLKLRFETHDWRFVLNTLIQQNCEKGWDLSLRSKIASDWRLAILPVKRCGLEGQNWGDSFLPKIFPKPLHNKRGQNGAGGGWGRKAEQMALSDFELFAGPNSYSFP